MHGVKHAPCLNQESVFTNYMMADDDGCIWFKSLANKKGNNDEHRD
jgi:hypothetical protein